MTGRIVRIIHSGLLPESRNALTTLRRLATFLRRASLAVAFISARSSSASLSSVSCPSSERTASAPISALKASPYCSRASRYLRCEQLLVLQRRLTCVGDDVALEVQDLLELLQCHVEQGADARGQRAQEPDVRDR